MLRAGPNGVQRIVPKALRASAGDGEAAAVPKKTVGLGSSAGNGAPGVLSFKTVVGKASGAAPPVAQAPLTPAAPPGTKAAPPTPAPRSKVKEEDEWEAGEAEEPDNTATKEEWDDEAGAEQQKGEAGWGVAPTTKTPPGTLMPTVKRPPPSKPTMPKAPGGKPSPKEETQDAPEEPADAVMETEDWVKQFDRKWQEAMAGTGGVKDEGLGDGPPAKRPRTGPEQPQAKFGPKQPSGPPPKHLTPQTPGKGNGKGGQAAPPAATGVDNDAQLREEHPEWSDRCAIEAAKPGQPQRLTISMAEVSLGDDGLTDWCKWMDRRLSVARPSTAAAAGRARFRAGTIDFSENELTAVGVKALCAMLEKHGVRSEVLRLTGNNIGNEGLRCIAKFLTSSSQAPAQELHMSRNKVTAEGLKWLLSSFAMHPAYPVWNNETERFVPMWLRIENNKIKPGAGYAALQAACSSLALSVCTGEKSGETKCGPRQCVNTGCSDEVKHNCVAHLTGWRPEGAEPLPAPSPHAKPLFAPPGRGAPKAAPSGVEEPVREEPRVVYEDDDLAIVLKPAGWSCLPQPKGVDPAWARLKPLARRKQVGELMTMASSAPPLQAWLLLHFGADPNCDASRDQGSDRGLAHRLDLDTSGPILIGKTLKGYEHARKQVLAGLLKDYVALVHGTLPTERGEIVAPIDASAYQQLKRVRVDSSGQPATTVWEAIAEYESPERRDERYTLVQCRVGTLRTHQIRAHLQHMGFPVVGDKLYGNGEPPSFCPRIFLHKCRIGFFNVKGQTCVETCSLQTAPDLWNALGCLRKVGGMAMKGCGAPGL
uniref:Pseudouridine synthase RsuA/RluA-like domain-containing protein n=1 Tax=Alexandrium monilatum TaxID=311494 RepID=A0A7S4RF37_9DINO